MNHWVCRTFQSTVGMKFLMALSGLFWCGFLVAHLAGNFLLFAGEEAFMAYANTFQANKLLMISAEIVMLAVLATHIGTALRLSAISKASRPDVYHHGQPPVAASLASRTMLQTGVVTLFFLGIHIWTFKFGTAPGETLYENVVRRFSNAPYAFFYVFAVCALGLHVSHGLQSAFQSLGLNHTKYNCKLKILSLGFGLFIAMGFSSIALYFLMRGEHL